MRVTLTIDRSEDSEAMNQHYRGGLPRTELLAYCRALRRNETDAERLLWRLLRDRQMAGIKFRRQHQFGPFILDFFAVEQRLAIEIDGGQHFSDARLVRDEARTAWLSRAGIRVLRFDNRQVLVESEAMVESILDALGEPPVPLPETIPSPQPSPRGRGGKGSHW